jgi:hypothetical protein
MLRKPFNKDVQRLLSNVYCQAHNLFCKLFNCKKEITIKKDWSIKNVQDQFRAQFPFLKIEFLKTFPNTKAIHKTKYAMPDDLFKRIPGFINDGRINIYSKQSILSLENNFKEHFGVSAQIFRRSGDVWIETTLTEDWTLEQQNKIGEEICAYRGLQNFSVSPVG